MDITVIYSNSKINEGQPTW